MGFGWQVVWLAGGVGGAGGGDEVCRWYWCPGTAVKADAAQDSAVFFNT